MEHPTYLSWQNNDGVEYELSYDGIRIAFGKQAFHSEIVIPCGDPKIAHDIFEKVRKMLSELQPALENIRELLLVELNERTL